MRIPARVLRGPELKENPESQLEAEKLCGDDREPPLRRRESILLSGRHPAGRAGATQSVDRGGGSVPAMGHNDNLNLCGTLDLIYVGGGRF